MDVGVGEVVGPDGGPFDAGLQVDGDADLAAAQVDQRAVLGRRGVAADPDAVDGDVEVGRVERGGGGADGGEDAAPVRVLAEDGRLEQGGPGDAAADLDGVVLGVGAEDRDDDVVLGALGVARSAACAGRRRPAVSASVRSGSDGVMPLEPLAITVTVSLVDMQPSESRRSKLTRVAARSAASRSARRRDGVGGEDDEHRGQLGREHAGALGHAADAPAGALDDGLLGHGVGGHDRERRRPRRRGRPGPRGRRRRRRAGARGRC